MTKSCSHLTELRSVRVQFELLRTCYYLTAKITILICVFSFVNVFATIHIKYHCAHFGVWLTHISERKTLQASSSLVKRYVHCRASQSSPPRTAAAAATFKSALPSGRILPSVGSIRGRYGWSLYQNRFKPCADRLVKDKLSAGVRVALVLKLIVLFLVIISLFRSPSIGQNVKQSHADKGIGVRWLFMDRVNIVKKIWALTLKIFWILQKIRN